MVPRWQFVLADSGKFGCARNWLCVCEDSRRTNQHFIALYEANVGAKEFYYAGKGMSFPNSNASLIGTGEPERLRWDCAFLATGLYVASEG